MSSRLAATPEAVWRHVVSPAGVNRELRPLLRMTFPRGVADLTASWRPGERLFRSWLLLGGVLPVEYDDLAFVEIEPGRRFLERSSLLTQRIWEHERIVEPGGPGARVRFEVALEPDHVRSCDCSVYRLELDAIPVVRVHGSRLDGCRPMGPP